MSNIYMDYLTESEREDLILEKEIELEIKRYDNEFLIESSMVLQGYNKKLNDIQKKYRTLTKSAKKNIQKGNFNEAEEEIKKAKKILIELRSDVEKEKPGFFSSVFDSIILYLPYIIISTISLLTLSTVGNIPLRAMLNSLKPYFEYTKFLSELGLIYSVIKKEIKEYKKTKKLKDIQMDDLNLFKHRVLDSLDKCIKGCDKLLEDINEAKKKTIINN